MNITSDNWYVVIDLANSLFLNYIKNEAQGLGGLVG